ncbi:MAG: twin-arginine translocation pathway signal protein [Proteobacteria bacterium]|nr:twin-arginine translocation pathway signal protein [Pseudomonadota bacterium]
MTLSRRKTLALIGGGVILAASGGAAFAVTRTPRTAHAPWTTAGGYDDPRLRALSYAILAPNPHNRQPWKVDVSVPDQVTLLVDNDRLLPHTDPFSRQIVIGLGCFLEIMALAAATDGYRVDLDLFPEGEDAAALDARPVAVARFTRGDARSEPALFGQIFDRRSLKEPYDMTRAVGNEMLAQLAASVTRGSGVAATNDMDEVAALRDLTAQAFEIEFRTPRTYKESVDLFRIGHREVDANPDGIDFSGPMWETLRLTRQFTREGAIPTDSFPFRTGLDMVTSTARTGMAYIWLTTPGNTRAEQIVAGRDWVRLNLAATGLGLGVQPMSQALQEFPEMADLHAQAHDRLAGDGGVVQMLGRLGYGPTVGPSPRWPLEEKLA